MNAKTPIHDVLKTGGDDTLDVWYSPDAITPEVLKTIRGMDEKTAEEDAVRTMLTTFGMEWNLKTYVAPADGDPMTTVTLPNGRTKNVKADADGNPVKIDVPSDFEGMKGVSLRVLFRVFQAIQDDARPKETNSVS